MTTYGDTLAGWMNGTPGMWGFLVLMLAVLGLVGGMVILIRAVKTAIDAA